MRNPRALLAAGVLVAAVALGVLLIAGAGGGSSGDRDRPPRVVRATLTLEQAALPDTGGHELVVSLPTAQLNTLEVTGGAQVVSLQCFDAGGAAAIDRTVDWPLLEEEGYPPHIHQPADARLLERIRSCRLSGPGIDFDGRVVGRLPSPE